MYKYLDKSFFFVVGSSYTTEIYIEAGLGCNIHYILKIFMKLISYFSTCFLKKT